MGSGEKPLEEKMNEAGAAARKTEDKSVGDALRRVYSEAIEEDVPDEMLDLLKKLN